MKIIVAPDSFKDALSAYEVAEAMAQGIRIAAPDDEIILFPLGDGGEGSSEILAHYLHASQKNVWVVDALGREVEAFYYLAEESRTAVIEMAQASGLQRISYDERDGMHTSSYGTGQLLLDAIHNGAQRIILAIGGSATNDAGMGMASALGVRFYDKNHRLLKGSGEELNRVSSYDKSQLKIPPHITIEVLCDVENPLYGKNGAAYVYAAQKGVAEKDIPVLDENLYYFSSVVLQQEKTNYAFVPGAGAAGGLGFGAMAFMGAKLFKGIDLILLITDFDNKIKGADYVFTGEGKVDGQTGQGKLIGGVVQHADAQNVPVIALCGALDLQPEKVQQLGLYSVFSIQSAPGTLQNALQRTAFDLRMTAYNVRRLLG